MRSPAEPGDSPCFNPYDPQRLTWVPAIRNHLHSNPRGRSNRVPKLCRRRAVPCAFIA
ncbi:hypothetical protein RB10891 [Rhodopirellula baltica SH 1]|uniref:Uncharacterized protein n=1 Tax=Rhodopirellula baltica (strain DSM 10527 / NCIMB 13988 / SH1) TaxID=243090 RepID=Q7UK32_RHOBA|nr:hypothetical protein RB10891 [Rhodopirellula baltica SH 1]